MSYLAQATMTSDPDLISRIAACAATRGVPEGRPWVVRKIWAFSAMPGWAERYAEATSDDDPDADMAAYVYHAGKDPEVITDAMILDAVNQVVSGGSPPSTETASPVE